jgi:hypothetical protein
VGQLAQFLSFFLSFCAQKYPVEWWESSNFHSQISHLTKQFHFWNFSGVVSTSSAANPLPYTYTCPPHLLFTWKWDLKMWEILEYVSQHEAHECGCAGYIQL